MTPRRDPNPRGPSSTDVPTREGTVIEVLGRRVRVGFADRTHTVAVVRAGLFRRSEIRQAVVVGDRVRVAVHPSGDPSLEEVLPRRAYLGRRHGETGAEQIIVANVDQVLIAVAAAEPAFRPRIIDRILVAAERGGFDAIIALTKIDLVEPSKREIQDGRLRLYRDMGYRAIPVSVRTEEGLSELREWLANRTTVLAGQSGVGKSTLIAAVEPGLDLKAQTVSEKWGKGRHTTTTVVMLPLRGGGFVVDTPGVRSFGISGLDPSDVAIFFRDMAPHVDGCRHRGCTHDHEPSCAVKTAVQAGTIHPDRYESYLRIIQGMDEDEG